MNLVVAAEPFDSFAAQTLVAAADAEYALVYPPDQMFGKNLRSEHLGAGRGVFIIARLDGAPVGCGALRRLNDSTGELKRMFVDPPARRRGVARAILDELTQVGREMGIQRLVLETGIHQVAAIDFYEKAGFRRTECFGEYFESPTSLCFEKSI